VRTAREGRIGIIIVAYNAASTLGPVLDRIPSSVRSRVETVLVCDDHSQDSTYHVGLEYQRSSPTLPLVVLRNESNLGYGGNQKVGYRWAIEHDLDVVVLLHGDGQYAPESIDDLLTPIVTAEADAVFGSRMMTPGSARQGGMPVYKYVGNRILTTLQNGLVGMSLSEWHSGYRAYSVDTLRAIPFEANSDGFAFDTEIIIQMHEANRRIVEVPIPTFYGDELCYVNGVKYARDVMMQTLRYRANKVGFGAGNMAFASPAYESKTAEDSSHATILAYMTERAPGRVLDLGCSDGALSSRLRKLGHIVTGIDSQEHFGVEDSVDRFLLADLDAGIPSEAGVAYDVIIAADVLEHVRHPENLLRDMHSCLKPGGTVFASIPNFSHWYPRLRTALGLFDYDRRGILDVDHVRFFTRRSFERLIEGSPFVMDSCQAVGLPFEVLRRGGSDPDPEGEPARPPVTWLQRLNELSVKARPSLFAYQYVVELSADPSDRLVRR
jgi:glycosyltransferase involved in cell wall biosynthesis